MDNADEGFISEQNHHIQARDSIGAINDDVFDTAKVKSRKLFLIIYLQFYLNILLLSIVQYLSCVLVNRLQYTLSSNIFGN